ncbi:MAG: hypothetical protein ACKVQU_33210 [Burkholderiales bacterium]
MRTITRSLLAAISLAATPAIAGTLADIEVISRATGQRLPVYHHDGKLFVAGNPGERYAVQVANKTGARIMTVVSVDGVNVVSGETATPYQSGYVLHPWQSYEINGWRKNQNEIAAFYFTSLPDSYAARTDRPQHVGVIGVAVFREAMPPRPAPSISPAPRPFERSGASGDTRANAGDVPADARGAAESESRKAESAGPATQSGAAPSSAPPSSLEADQSIASPRRQLSRERIGTGHGERESSHVAYTHFRRASPNPNELLTIHYDRYDNLVARGIIPGAPRFAEPQPFPGGIRFAPDPRS